MTGILVKLAFLFLGLSLLAVGGGNSVIPAMQHAAVTTEGWMTDKDFLNLFAISRLAPGPGSLIASLVGQKAAGLAGAAVATLAMYGPTCLLVHAAARVWGRYRDAAWRVWVERALAPVSIGLIFASAIALMRGTETGIAAPTITAAAALILTLTEFHPLLVLALGGLCGFLFRF